MAEANLNVSTSSGKDETVATSEQPQQIRAGLREIVVQKPTVVSGEHGLENSWVFWWSTRGAKTEVEWEHSFRLLGSFGSVEQFWRLFSSFSLALDLKPKFEVYMFRFGFKPLWEDEENKAGGKFVIVLPKGLTTKLWEKLILSLIGEQMDIGPQIVGIVLSPRYLDDHISIWVRDASTHSAIKEKIQNFFSEVAPEKITFKAHVESIKDSAIHESKMKENVLQQQNANHPRAHSQQGYNSQYNSGNNNSNNQSQGSYNNYSGGGNYRGNNNRYHNNNQHYNNNQQGQGQGQLNNSGEQQNQQQGQGQQSQNPTERDADGFTFKKFNKGAQPRGQTPNNQGENPNKNYRNSPNRNNMGTGGYVNPNRVPNRNNNNSSNNNSSNNNTNSLSNETLQNFSELQTTGMSLYPQRPNANNNSNNNSSTNNNSSNNNTSAATSNTTTGN